MKGGFKAPTEEEGNRKKGGKKTYHTQIMKQKGAIRANISEDQYGQIMKVFSTAGIARLPIPSQVHTICAIDSFQSVLWYADGVRDFLWDRLRMIGGTIDVACENFDTMTPEQILTCWIVTAGVRISGILLGPSIETTNPSSTEPGFRRRQSLTRQGLGQLVRASEFGKTDERCAVGDEAGILLHAYLNKLAGRPVDVDKETFEVPTFWFGRVLDGLWKSLGLSPAFSWLYQQTLPQNTELVAKIITCNYVGDSTMSSAHTLALTKIGGRWHFLDNEVGISIPIDEDYNNDAIIGNSVLGFRSFKKQGQDIRTAQVIMWQGDTIIPISGEYESKRRAMADKTKTYNWKQGQYILIVRGQVNIDPYLVRMEPSTLRTTLVPVTVRPIGNGVFDVTEEGTPLQRVRIGAGSSFIHLKIGNEQFPVEPIQMPVAMEVSSETSTSTVTVPPPAPLTVAARPPQQRQATPEELEAQLNDVLAPAPRPFRLTPQQRKTVKSSVESEETKRRRLRLNPQTEQLERQVPLNLKIIAPLRAQLRNVQTRNILREKRRRETQRKRIEQERFRREEEPQGGRRKRKTHRKQKINATHKKTRKY